MTRNDEFEKVDGATADAFEPQLGFEVLHRGIDFVLDELRLERQDGGGHDFSVRAGFPSTVAPRGLMRHRGRRPTRAPW